MQRGSLRGHHEEKQVMSSVGSEADVVGEDSKPGVSWKRREVTWFACCVGRPGGWAGPFHPHCASCFLREKLARGRRGYAPAGCVGCLSLGLLWVRTPAGAWKPSSSPAPHRACWLHVRECPARCHPWALAALVWCPLRRQPRAPCHLVLVPLPSQPLAWCPPMY